MSIAFGLYDFFSYTVPGFLYILIFNQALVLLKLPNLNILNQSSNLGGTLLWIAIAYVTGHLMDSISIKWYYLINKFHAETKAMGDFKSSHKDLQIDFKITERKTLFSVIRHNNLELARYIDNFKAISIMLNNISLALLLFAAELILTIFITGSSLALAAGTIVAATFSFIAIKRSALFNEWHWSAVYEHARQYGKSVPEMFKTSVNKPGK